MQKYGKTATGTQRWMCTFCKSSGIKKRLDTRARHLMRWFVRWITGTATLSEIAIRHRHTRRQMVRLFGQMWKIPAPQPPHSASPHSVLIVDGVYLSGRHNAVLIGRDLERVVFWSFAERECFAAWYLFFSHIAPPRVIVMDGQKGLDRAVQIHFPHVPIQRCLVHVERYIRTCISSRPKTDAGHKLWILTRSLWNVKTQEDAEVWRRSFALWCEHYETFLKERSYAPLSRRWWYTHRTLRAARTHLTNALPHLFTFTELSGTPRTSNHVEGGVNARLKELVRRHRGMSPERKRVLAAYFLEEKRSEKPTRNVS